jgi:peptidoglycan biosynthesis protein MviN/MurJ (putative lipid II flippase)
MTASLNLLLLFYALRRKLGRLEMAGLGRTVLTLAGLAALAGFASWALSRAWETRLGHAQLLQKLGAVFIPGALAGLIYCTGAVWLKVPAAREITEVLARRFRRAG